MLFAVKINAQDVQLVTLQHGDNTSVFYGADGFINALNAAVDKDLITLSSGVFTPTTITKAVTIQGAGYVNDIANNRYRTSFGSNLNIKMPSGKEGLNIEGIYCGYTINIDDTIVSLTFKKCCFTYVRFIKHTVNCNINQCRIQEFFPDMSSENLCVSNSIIGIIHSNYTDSQLSYQNDIIVGCTGDYTTHGYYNITANFKNCIINPAGIDPRSSAYNNASMNNIADLQNLTAQSNNWLVSASDLFANSSENTYNESYTYKLNDAAAAKYLGTDGKQIGIYGGDTSFTDVPSNPQIIKRAISDKSTTDGKLNVNITVEAQP